MEFGHLKNDAAVAPQSFGEIVVGPMDISIAIPTYNGAQRLPQVLDRLQTQELPDEIIWEVIVIDNNSQDDTAKVVENYQKQWPLRFPLRYLFEPQQGAAFARQAAIHASKAELIGFLDDDNLPASNWVSEAVTFSHQHPEAGAFSGCIQGCYEVAPPDGFDQIKAYLAIRDHGSTVIEFQPKKLQLPPAASLVVRRQAWLDCVPSEPALTGKLPGLFIQGDDYEPLLYLHNHQWAILYNPSLKTLHKIPKQRFEREYLLALARGCGLATCQLALITTETWRKPLIALRIFLGSLRRLSQQFMRRQADTKHELAVAFEHEFNLGSLLSPFYVRRW